MRALALIISWGIVVIGWAFYGLVLLATILHPRKTDPIEDMKQLFSGDKLRQHWQFTLIMIVAIIVYYLAWGYIQETKEERKKQHETDKTHNSASNDA